MALKWIPGMTPPRSLTTVVRAPNGSIKSARVDLTRVYGIIGEMGQAANEEMRTGMEQMARFGSDKMRELILQRGTDFSEEAYAEGINQQRGRYRTGKMYDDVQWRAEIGPKKIYARFGWIYNFQDYYAYQETGFMNRGGWARPLQGNSPFIRAKGKAKWTTGMFALFDARQYVKDIAKVIGPKIAASVAARGRKAGK
jgi:hypothetical protein